MWETSRTRYNHEVMETLHRLAVFTLGDQHLALPITRVERVVRAVSVTPTPDMPPIVLGLINVHGRIIPVIDLRPMLGISERPVEPSDYFLIAQSPVHTIALLAETLGEVLECTDADIQEAPAILPGLSHISGAMKHGEEMILIYQLDDLLSAEIENRLKEAQKVE
jgi:purine-binding chemotaxis protein CheW